jgi:hypothetical protein
LSAVGLEWKAVRPIEDGAAVRLPGFDAETYDRRGCQVHEAILMKDMWGFTKAAALFFGAIFLLFWLVGPPKTKGPSTGESCLQLTNRLFAQRDRRSPTPQEWRDLDLCGD